MKLQNTYIKIYSEETSDLMPLRSRSSCLAAIYQTGKKESSANNQIQPRITETDPLFPSSRLRESGERGGGKRQLHDRSQEGSLTQREDPGRGREGV